MKNFILKCALRCFTRITNGISSLIGRRNPLTAIYGRFENKRELWYTNYRGISWALAPESRRREFMEECTLVIHIDDNKKPQVMLRIDGQILEENSWEYLAKIELVQDYLNIHT